MVHVCLAAAELLAPEGISAEVVDPRTLSPLDEELLVRSAEKTGRAIVVDEGRFPRLGVSAELASVIGERAFYQLDAPVRRLGAMDVPVPFSPPLEDQTVPTPESVAAAARGQASAAAAGGSNGNPQLRRHGRRLGSRLLFQSTPMTP